MQLQKPKIYKNKTNRFYTTSPSPIRKNSKNPQTNLNNSKLTTSNYNSKTYKNSNIITNFNSRINNTTLNHSHHSKSPCLTEHIYSSYSNKLKDYYTNNKNDILLYGSKKYDMLTVDKFVQEMSVYKNIIIDKIKENPIYLYNNCNFGIKSNDEHLILTPLAEKEYSKMDFIQKDEFQNAERRGVVMRKIEYTHLLNDNMTSKNNDENAKVFIVMKNAVDKIEKNWINNSKTFKINKGILIIKKLFQRKILLYLDFLNNDKLNDMNLRNGSCISFKNNCNNNVYNNSLNNNFKDYNDNYCNNDNNNNDDNDNNDNNNDDISTNNISNISNLRSCNNNINNLRMINKQNIHSFIDKIIVPKDTLQTKKQMLDSLQKKYYKVVLDNKLCQDELNKLKTDLLRLSDYKENLEKEKNSLSSDNENLVRNYNTLDVEYKSLRKNNKQLQNDYNDLNENYITNRNDLYELKNKYNNLEKLYNVEKETNYTLKNNYENTIKKKDNDINSLNEQILKYNIQITNYLYRIQQLENYNKSNDDIEVYKQQINILNDKNNQYYNAIDLYKQKYNEYYKAYNELYNQIKIYKEQINDLTNKNKELLNSHKYFNNKNKYDNNNKNDNNSNSIKDNYDNNNKISIKDNNNYINIDNDNKQITEELNKKNYLLQNKNDLLNKLVNDLNNRIKNLLLQNLKLKNGKMNKENPEGYEKVLSAESKKIVKKDKDGDKIEFNKKIYLNKDLSDSMKEFITNGQDKFVFGEIFDNFKKRSNGLNFSTNDNKTYFRNNRNNIVVVDSEYNKKNK